MTSNEKCFPEFSRDTVKLIDKDVNLGAKLPQQSFLYNNV